MKSPALPGFFILITTKGISIFDCLMGNTRIQMDIRELKIHSVLLKIFDGEANHDEKKEIERWLKVRPENQALFDSLRQSYSDAGKSVAPNTDTDKAFMVLNEKLQLTDSYSKEIKKTFLSSWIFRAAAILVTLLGIAFLFTSNEKNTIISNLSNEVLWDTLIDGSVICLNSNSEIVLEKSFGKTTRKLNLQGEAWFNVAPDKSRPFIVCIDDLKVKVVGTSFNIRTSQNSETTDVFVESGKVQFYNFEDELDDNSFKLDLSPGELARYENNEVAKIPVPDPNYLAWKSGMLVFEQAPLSVVVEKLENQYGVHITCALANPDRYLITASFDNKTPESILQGINNKLHFGYGTEEYALKISKE
ncbi:MAG: FecR domain-containing protein [Bacteroidales bacterium]|nr:FecR domain-containing protein [Bacteroidales bacterium]MCF8456666.1 FecR domain-containing protein [Bacteroidales bacterium]